MLFFLSNKNKKLALRIISGILLFQCIVVGGIGFYFYNTTNHFIGKSLHAQGTVIAMLQSSDSLDRHPSISYYPKVTFKDNTGKITTFNSQISNNPPEYVKGDKVPVLYDPDNPGNARINQFSTLWLIPLICFMVAAVALVACVGFGIWSRFTPR